MCISCISRPNSLAFILRGDSRRRLGPKVALRKFASLALLRGEKRKVPFFFLSLSLSLPPLPLRQWSYASHHWTAKGGCYVSGDHGVHARLDSTV